MLCWSTNGRLLRALIVTQLVPVFRSRRRRLGLGGPHFRFQWTPAEMVGVLAFGLKWRNRETRPP